MENDATKAEDCEIIRRIIQGDTRAFDHLVAGYGGRVLSILKRHLPSGEVEEAAQEVFIKAYRSLASFRGESGFESWISRIAVRTCYDYWRKAYRSREIPFSSLTERHRLWLEKAASDRSESSFNRMGAREEAREVLEWALARLSAEDRMVMELVYLEGLPVREAARLLGWSVSNVKVRSFRSRRKLKRILVEAMKG